MLLYFNVDQGNTDLFNAFDIVSHDILSQKREQYGISGVTLDWTKSYLSDRRQKLCVFEGSASQLRTITCGVPHGSIFGPLPSSVQ